MSILHSIVRTTCSVVKSCPSCVLFFLQGMLPIARSFSLQIPDCQLSILDCGLSRLYVSCRQFNVDVVNSPPPVVNAMRLVVNCLLPPVMPECLLSILDWLWSIALFHVFLFCEFSPLPLTFAHRDFLGNLRSPTLECSRKPNHRPICPPNESREGRILYWTFSALHCLAFWKTPSDHNL